MKPLFSTKIDRYVYLNSCPSTNEYAVSSISNNDPKKNICVYTYNQSAGRGQIGRKWYSGADKNLSCTYSIPLDSYPATDQFFINMAFALAIKDFISVYISSGVTIKWPNDIYVDTKKVAGILIQNHLRAASISTTNLGVGINVLEEAFPKDLPNPISIVQLIKRALDLTALQHHLSDCIMQRLLFLGGREQELTEAYLSSLYLLNQEATFIIADQKQQATIRGVSAQGKLELELNGKIQLFNFRELGYHLA